MKSIVSPFKGLRIEDFMKIHGSMPDCVQIRSFLTVNGPERTQDLLSSSGRATRGVQDLTMTPQPNRYQTMKQSPPEAGNLNMQGPSSDADQNTMGC